MSMPSPEVLERELQRIRKLAEAFASAIRTDFGRRVKAVVLYGSAIRGDWTPESDVDVLILLDEVDPCDVDRITLRALRMGLLESGVLLQPVVMSEARFAHLRQRERVYALAVAREGVPL